MYGLGLVCFAARVRWVALPLVPEASEAGYPWGMVIQRT
jgi:hypothetical protein